jgi:hypothetical protein
MAFWAHGRGLLKVLLQLLLPGARADGHGVPETGARAIGRG